MKVVIIGPGIMPIPPKGWGAVEILVWDYATILREKGWDVRIVNNENREIIVRETNDFNPDFVHLQYDNFIDVLDRINCKNKAATSHFGYLEQYERHGGYRPLFEHFINCGHTIFALSQGIKDTYVQYGCDPSRIYVTPNGARKNLFRYDPECKFTDKSICLAKIDYRKRQKLTQDYKANVYFAGNIAPNDGFIQDEYYLGEWEKNYLYDNLTNYSNLVLLSDGEADPLVTKEALMSGLGLVISQYSYANLDLEKPFIEVIPENKLCDHSYVKEKIEENRRISCSMREEIRQYAIDNFSWENIISKYMNLVEGIVNNG